jgi:hypothetical protein
MDVEEVEDLDSIAALSCCSGALQLSHGYTPQGSRNIDTKVGFKFLKVAVKAWWDTCELSSVLFAKKC